MLIEIVVYQGVDELDAIGPLEVLRNARTGGVDIETRLVSLEEEAEVIASHGLRFRPDGVLGLHGRPDVLLVPGGGWANRTGPGAWAEAQRGALPRAIARSNREGTILASVCTGTMLLAAAGVISGRNAVTHRSAIDDLRNAGAHVIDARVVDDGDIITSGGVASGLDLGLYLVERFANADMAGKIANAMEYERRGPVWKRSERAASAQARQ
jgi:transcriptional regulator GlxA family with amidase domain